MESKKVKNIIWALTGVLCFGFVLLIFNNTGQDRWFSDFIIFYYLIGLTVIYLIGLLVAGLVIRFLKDSKASISVFKATGLSFIALLFLSIFTYFFKNKEFTEWKMQNEKERVVREKAEEENYNSKLDSLTQVMSSNPNNYEAFVERGLMKRQIGKYEASIADYQKALEIKPDHFRANLEMGYSLGLIGEKEQQKEFYRRAVRLDSTSYFAKKNPEYLK